MGGDTPDPGEPAKRSKLTNPFVLALIPAVTAILIAVLTIVTKSDSSSSSTHTPPSAPPPTQAESDLGIRVDRDVNAYSDGWNAVFAGALPKSTGLPAKSDYEAALAWASTRGMRSGSASLSVSQALSMGRGTNRKTQLRLSGSGTRTATLRKRRRGETLHSRRPGGRWSPSCRPAP